MRKFIDWCINTDKELSQMTTEQKLKYREDVIAGIKDKAYWLGMFIVCGIIFASCIWLTGALGN